MKTQINCKVRKLLTIAVLTLALTSLPNAHGGSAEDPKIVAPETVGLSAERLNAITTHLQSCVREGKIAGAVTLIGRRGKIAYFEAVGYADVESKTPMTRDALFRIASMTKVVTAVAALSLHEEGRFSLDDDAARYLSELRQCRVKAPPAGGSNTTNATGTVPLQKPITIRDLLRHTSGITYGYERGSPVDVLFREHAVWNEEGGIRRLVEALTQTPLAFQPGTDFRYSFSSDVLGCLLENVVKQPLNDILRQRVLDPLQMTDSGFHVRSDQAGRLTSYYAYEDGRLVRKESATNSPFLSRPKAFSGGGGWPDGHAGLLTTATDWWRFCEMIRHRGQLNGIRVLQEKTVALMVTNQLDGIGDGFNPRHPGQGYGCGVGLIVDRDRADDSGSNGQIFWAGGPYNTYFFIDGAQEMVGIFLLQTGPWRHLGLMDRFNKMAHQAIEDTIPRQPLAE
jgi:CubicO group peptidase (beta-lactamase class C family)